MLIWPPQIEHGQQQYKESTGTADGDGLIDSSGILLGKSCCRKWHMKIVAHVCDKQKTYKAKENDRQSTN